MVTVSCPSSTSLCFYVESSVSLLSVVPPSFWAVFPLVTPCSKPLADKSLVGCDRSPSFLLFGSWSNIRVLGWFWDLQLCHSSVFSRCHQVGDGVTWFLNPSTIGTCVVTVTRSGPRRYDNIWTQTVSIRAFCGFLDLPPSYVFIRSGNRSSGLLPSLLFYTRLRVFLSGH